MESMRRADSILSISSIISDFAPNNEDPVIAAKTNSMLKVLLEAISEVNTENATISNEILELLNTFKFDMRSLSSNLRESLQVTSAILKSEGIPSIDETALQICLERRKMQNRMKEREERLFKARYNTEFSKYNSLQEKLSCMGKEIEQIEDALQLKILNGENIESNRILWSNRLQDYRGTIEKLEKDLYSLHSEEMSLDKMSEKSSILMNKLNDLSQLNSALDKYGDLPPNLLQAKNMLECKERELEEIEELMIERMNN